MIYCNISCCRMVNMVRLQRGQFSTNVEEPCTRLFATCASWCRVKCKTLVGRGCWEYFEWRTQVLNTSAILYAFYGMMPFWSILGQGSSSESSLCSRQVLEKHGLNSSLPVQISAEKFVSRAVPGNPWIHQNEFCRESVKISGILKTLNQLELEDEEEDFMIAAAVANASAHRHLNEPWFTETNGGAVRATLVGKNTHCALRAFRIGSSMATAVETPHLAFVAATAAASATADRLASWGAPSKTIGQLAFQAARGVIYLFSPWALV